MNTYTKEQREAWDKITGPGLYNVEGQQAYQYLCNRLKWLVIDKSDPHTVLVIGNDKNKEQFFKKMIDEGVIDDFMASPEFRFYPDYDPDGDDPDEFVPRSCWSENDTDELFCNFIRNAKVNGYNNVAAVLILDMVENELRYVDRLLKIPVWRGSTLEKNIELPVYVAVCFDEKGATFEKENNTNPSGVKRTLELVRGDEVKLDSVEMLVPGVIVKNAPNAFSGEMGEKKSTMAVHIGAAGSMWGDWFTGEKNHTTPFITLFAGAEDDYSTTIVPRFIAAGGDPRNLYLVPLTVKCKQEGKDGLQEWETPLSFDEHLELLADHIRQINNNREWKVGLLINDPIISFFGNKNYNSSQDARVIMAGLKKLCEELQITVINICHYNKSLGMGAKQKTAGAKALIEAHRMAWAFDSEGDGDNITLMAPIKHNLLKEAKSYKITTESKEIEWAVGDGYYQSAEVGVIKFVGYSKKTADDRIEEKESKDRGNRKELKNEILRVLADGPQAAGQVCNQLQDMGSMSSIGRAARSLEEEGKLRKSGNNRKNMVWQLATEAEQPTFDEVTNGI